MTTDSQYFTRLDINLLTILSWLPIEPLPAFFDIKSEIFSDLPIWKGVNGPAHQFINLIFSEAKHVGNAFYIGDLPRHCCLLLALIDLHPVSVTVSNMVRSQSNARCHFSASYLDSFLRPRII
jgi:hypothetical protein